MLSKGAASSGGLVAEVEAVVELESEGRGEGEGGRGGWLARHGTSIRWARLTARMFGHGHRAVCGGGRHLEVVEECVLADNGLQTETQSCGECK